MKRHLLAYLIALLPLSALAQFNSGSTGAYGAMNITADTTLAMPDDGIFHCTTINIAANKTLKFTKNSRNTPVYLLATGDVVITGTITVSGGDGSAAAGGVGGPGAFDGGQPGFGSDTPPGSGNGPGGGKGGAASGDVTTGVGAGSFGTQAPTLGNKVKSGAIYGSRLLIPIIGGSGGGGIAGSPGYGGGGGGGAILIASTTKITFNGLISSIGGNLNSLNQGSGGAIRLVAPRVEGSGYLDAYGGGNGYGGMGRTRIDTLDRSSMPTGGVSAAGGVMFVFPNPLPKLSVTSAAGTAIAEGSTAAVNLFLPSGTSPNQAVTVRARDFGQSVPIRVELVPDSGDPIIYDTAIDNSAANPADGTVNVVLPVNQQVRVQVWTR